MIQNSRLAIKGGSEKRANRIQSESLLDEHGRIVIVHQGEEYLLRRTRLGKLILTK
ncbi:MAG: hemin uptake protein HemP [Acidiferrobacterales bacterium]